MGDDEQRPTVGRDTADGIIPAVTGRVPTSFVVPAPPAESSAVLRLRRVCLAVVAAMLIAAGGWKLYRPAESPTMIARAFPSPRAQRAIACLEIALGLWLLSGKSPRLAPAVAAAGLIATGCLMTSEFRRDRPLPCGCFPVRAVPIETAAVRRDLSLSIGRNAFLAVLCGLAAFTAPPEADPEA